jgi:hypothetical protein
MQEFMTSAAQQFDDQEKLPDFREEDIEMAINEATTPDEQFAQIERKYGIPRDVMERLESNFVGVTNEALVPARKPSEYQKALHQLLDLAEETMMMNQKKMPYEHPKLPSKLPLSAAKLIYPDFEFNPADKAKEADIMEEMKAIAIHNSPEGMKARAEKEKNLTDFFEEEQRKLDPEYDQKKKLREQALFELSLKEVPAEKPGDVITSVKVDVNSLLKTVPAKGSEAEVMDLSDDDIEVVFEEDAPPTVKDVRKSA